MLQNLHFTLLYRGDGDDDDDDNDDDDDDDDDDDYCSLLIYSFVFTLEWTIVMRIC